MNRRLFLSCALLVGLGCSGQSSPQVGAGVVSGTVSITGALTSAGVQVTLTGPSSAATVTSSTGAYSFQSLLPGAYLVTASAPSTAPAFVTAAVMVTALTASAPPVTVPVLKLTGLGTVNGSVTLGNATGNAGITVAAAGTSAVTTTDDAGTFSLTDVPTGTATIVASFPGYSSATATAMVAYNQAVTTTAMTLESSAASGTGTIQGTISVGPQEISPGGAGSLASVTLTLAGPVNATTTASEEGAYTFTSLPSGTYAVTAVVPSTVQLIQTISVTLSGSTAMAPNIAFSPLGTVTGNASFGASTGNGGIVVAASGSSAVTVTDDAGNFSLADVPGGTTTIIASSPGYKSASTTVMVDWEQSALASPLTLSPAGGQGTISGVITVSGVSSLPNLTVTVAGPVTAVAMTDDQGNYSIPNVPDGTFTVSATVPSTLEGTQLTTVVVSGGVGSASSLVFTPLGAVTGTATFGTQAGNAGILVSVPGTSALAVTTDSGAYTLATVPAGTQAIVATSPGYASATQSGVQVSWQNSVTAPPLTLSATKGTGGITGSISLAGVSSLPKVTVTADGPMSAATTSSATGAYSFSNLLPGTYTVSATVPSTAQGVQVTTVAVAQTTATASTLSFTALGTVTGVASLTGAASSAGIMVAAAGTASFGITGSNGQYTLSNVPAGTQSIIGTFPGYGSSTISVNVVYNQSTIATAFTLSPGTASGVIAGLIALSGELSTGTIPVTAIGPASAATLTSTTGTYSFANVPNGSYEVSATVPSTLEGTVSTVVTVSGGAATQASTLTFTPLGNVSGTVTLGNPTGNAGIIVTVPGSGVSALTSDNGSYVLRGVPISSGSLVASFQGYVAGSTPVNVLFGQTSSAGTITLVPTTVSGGIQGSVTIAGAATNAGVVLTLAGPVSGAATSNAAGTYSFSSLPNGSYTIIATAQGTAQGTQQTTANVVGGAVTAATAIAFTGLGTITGTATLAGAASSAGIVVGVVGLPEVALTSAAGKYTITGVPAGTQSVLASYAGYTSATQSSISVTYNQSTTAPAITLAVATNPGSLTGTVQLAGMVALPNASVSLAGPTSATAFTSATGTYTFTNLPSGAYTVTVSALSTVEGVQDTPVTVATTAATATTLTFHGLGSLGGVATLGATTGNAGIIVALPGTGISATTDDGGSYLLRNVPVGAQALAASYAGYTTATGSATAAYATTVTVGALTLVKSTSSGAVNGTVVLSNTTAPAGLSVTLAGPETLVGTTTSGGAYSFTGLPAGTYTVTVNVASTLELLQSEQVTVATGAVTAPALNFTALGTVTGTATLAGQGSNANAGIIVSVSGSGLSGVTNAAGAYTIKNVPAGAASLLATMPNFAAATVSATVPYDASVTATAMILASAAVTPTTTVSGVATLFDQSSSAGVTVTVQGTSLTATTSSTGAYSIASVPVGVINLQFSATGGYAETLSNVVAAQDTTGTFDGPSLEGNTIQTYVLAQTPMDVPKGTRLLSGITALPGTVGPSGADVVVNVPGTTGTTTEVLAIPAGTAASVAQTGAYPPFWTDIGADNQYVSWAEYVSSGYYNVNTYQLSTGTVTNIETDVPGTSPTFVQAGAHFAWYTCTPSSAGCLGYSSNTPGTLPEPLISLPAGSSISYFAMTPDGLHVVWIQNVPSSGYSLNFASTTNGTVIAAVNDVPSAITPVEITADSKYFVYEYSNTFYTVPVGASTPTALTTSMTYYPMPIVDFLVYVGTCGATSGLCSAGLSNGIGSPLANNLTGYTSIASYNAMTAAPGGVQLCFVPNVTPYKLTCANAGGGSATALGSSDQTPRMVFTTNGSYVAWTNGVALLSDSTGGGTVAQLLSSGYQSAAAIDTTHLAVLYSASSGVSTLAVANLAGSPVTLTTLASNVETFAVSPDGTRVAYIDLTDNWLYTVPATGGTPTAITRYASSFEWIGTSHQLLFIRHGTVAPFAFQDGLYTISSP